MHWKRCSTGALAVLALLVGATSTQAAGYLNGAPLVYAVPAPPATGSEIARMDLAIVRANQVNPANPAWQEADGDARAYNGDEIIARFADAWGGPLRASDRPILVHVLARVIEDTSAHAAKAKVDHPRDRPYVGHADIPPCNLNYLKDNESYPSGHAMNGYVVGAVLADIRPGREQALLARGVRYGDNRVVCGVHHPIDVQQGRLLAIAYLEALRADPAFRTELQCAREEDLHLADAKHALPAGCAALARPAKSEPAPVQAPEEELF